MTELIWDGKYKDGKKVSPVRIVLPFQTVETVNESVQERQKTLDFLSSGRDSSWRNRLIWGDKKYVLPSLLPEFSGKLNLIYIDPPFDTGADFSFSATIPDNPETEDNEETSFTKQPSLLEQKAYRDTWGRGLDSYLQWFYETVILLRELLAEDGSIYVHLDWHVGHYAKTVLDEVIGANNFKNELVWKRTGAGKPVYNNFPRNSDSIFYYTASEKYVFNRITVELTEEDKKTFSQDDRDGRGPYNTQPIINPDIRPNLQYVYTTRKGQRYLPPKNGWRFNEKRMSDLELNNRLVFTENTIREKYYLNERIAKGKQVPNVWDDVQNVQGGSKEKLNYNTQKPEALLDRIIRASSLEDALVLDCFCGSGTTVAVAEKLNRRWIACDLGRFAIHTTRKRLLSVQNVKPFVVQNLGKYERQHWQVAEFGDAQAAGARELRYRQFILELYHATPVTGYTWLHGIKDGHMVHVGPVDAPVTLADVKAIAAECWKTIGKGPNSPERAAVDILGWDWSFEVNEGGKQVAAEARVDVSFKKIPREVLEKKAVDQGDIKFFELAALSIDVCNKGKQVTLALSNFVIPPDDVPSDVTKAITHWSQWVDYWAVDWNYREDTFHNEWQSYRTKQNPTLELTTMHAYDKSGEYSVVVKVIDILGNDTTKLLKVKVA